MGVLVEMTSQRFFELLDGHVRGALEGRLQRRDTRGARDDWRLARYGEAVEPDLAVVLERGGRPLSFLWAEIHPLVSDSLAALIKASSLTGWISYPVDVRRHDGTPLGGYRALGVTGRCDRICYGEGYSQRVERDFPGGTFLHYKGLYVDVESWDGSDFIVGRDRKYQGIVVTERVRDLLRCHGAKNYSLTPVEDFEFPVLPAVKIR